MHHSERLARDVLQAGARGYVMKSDADQSLIGAVESLRQHKPFLTSKVTEFVLDDYIRRGELREDAPRDAITPREREVIQLLAEGNSNKETAAALGVSVKTHRGAPRGPSRHFDVALGAIDLHSEPQAFKVQAFS